MYPNNMQGLPRVANTRNYCMFQLISRVYLVTEIIHRDYLMTKIRTTIYIHVYTYLHALVCDYNVCHYRHTFIPVVLLIIRRDYLMTK